MGQAAMVPIVSQDVAGETLSIVNARGVGEQIAQNGFRLRNDSDLRLSGGPITVYAGGIYGGDARLEGLSPRDSKLIAYGIDLDLVAKRDNDDVRTQLLQIVVNDGLLQRRVQSFLTQKYNFKNKATKAKTVLIQQTPPGSYELIDPKQREEKSTEGDRFSSRTQSGRIARIPDQLAAHLQPNGGDWRLRFRQFGRLPARRPNHARTETQAGTLSPPKRARVRAN